MTQIRAGILGQLLPLSKQINHRYILSCLDIGQINCKFGIGVGLAKR